MAFSAIKSVSIAVHFLLLSQSVSATPQFSKPPLSPTRTASSQPSTRPYFLTNLEYVGPLDFRRIFGDTSFRVAFNQPIQQSTRPSLDSASSDSSRDAFVEGAFQRTSSSEADLPSGPWRSGSGDQSSKSQYSGSGSGSESSGGFAQLSGPKLLYSDVPQPGDTGEVECDDEYMPSDAYFGNIWRMQEVRYNMGLVTLTKLCAAHRFGGAVANLGMVCNEVTGSVISVDAFPEFATEALLAICASRCRCTSRSPDNKSSRSHGMIDLTAFSASRDPSKRRRLTTGGPVVNIAVGHPIRELVPIWDPQKDGVRVVSNGKTTVQQENQNQIPDQQLLEEVQQQGTCGITCSSALSCQANDFGNASSTGNETENAASKPCGVCDVGQALDLRTQDPVFPLGICAFLISGVVSDWLGGRDVGDSTRANASVPTPRYCACNATYVSEDCCGAPDGIVPPGKSRRMGHVDPNIFR